MKDKVLVYSPIADELITKLIEKFSVVTAVPDSPAFNSALPSAAGLRVED